MGRVGDVRGVAIVLVLSVVAGWIVPLSVIAVNSLSQALLVVITTGFIYSTLPLREAWLKRDALRRDGRNGQYMLVAQGDLRREALRTAKAFLLMLIFLLPQTPIGPPVRGVVSGLVFIVLTDLFVLSVLFDRLDLKRLHKGKQ